MLGQRRRRWTNINPHLTSFLLHGCIPRRTETGRWLASGHSENPQNHGHRTGCTRDRVTIPVIRPRLTWTRPHRSEFKCHGSFRACHTGLICTYITVGLLLLYGYSLSQSATEKKIIKNEIIPTKQKILG